MDLMIRKQFDMKKVLIEEKVHLANRVRRKISTKELDGMDVSTHQKMWW